VTSRNEELRSAVELLRSVADVMRRSDPLYVEARPSDECSATTDDEWDEVLEEVETFIDDIDAIGLEKAI